MQLFEKIKHGRYDFPNPAWDHISKDAKEVIANLLMVEPSKRWTCEQLVRNPWIQGVNCSDNVFKRYNGK
jgi:serine/threonine protein kinase